MSGFTPVNQVRLTNVAYVRLNKNGHRFEIACYRNKVLSWRSKIETDIREVLQTDSIFSNVSKGMLASSKDLLSAFGTTDSDKICSEILLKGEIQVSEQERGALYETVFRDVASIVAEKTINPETNRSYTVSMIQNSMRQIQYSINISKSSKSQALDVIKKLRAVMPIARANMIVRICCLSSDVESILARLQAVNAKVLTRSEVKSQALNEEIKVTSHMEVLVDPEHYKILNEQLCGPSTPYETVRFEILQLRADAPTSSSSGTAEAGHDGVSSYAAIEHKVTPGELIPQSLGSSAQASKGKKSDKKNKKTTKNDNDKKYSLSTSKRKDSDDVLASLVASIGKEDDENIDEGTEEEMESNFSNLNLTDAKLRKLPMLQENSDDESNSEKSFLVNEEDYFTQETCNNNFNNNNNNNNSDINGALIAINSDDNDYIKVEKEKSKSVTNESSDESDEENPPIPSSALSEAKPNDIKKAVGESKTTLKESVAGKKGKRGKRIEKEEQKLREAKAAELKARISANKAKESELKVESVVQQPSVLSQTESVAVASASTSKSCQSCNTCGGEYFDSQSYRNHFKSELHRVNLKRKMKNLAVFTTEEELLAAGANELS